MNRDPAQLLPPASCHLAMAVTDRQDPWIKIFWQQGAGPGQSSAAW
jgi:hypothetical protein